MNDASHRLEALEAFVIAYDRRGKTRRQFWDEFHEIAGDLDQRAEESGDLHWRYCEILATADDAGYMAPEERMDEVMGG